MSTTLSELQGPLSQVIERMGLRLVQMRREHTDRALAVVVALPKRFHTLLLREDELAPTSRRAIDDVLKQLDIGARVLFADTVEHIAKHDTSPLDRVHDLEARARNLIDAVDAIEGNVPFAAARRLTMTKLELQELLEHKPGSAAWRGSKGYGGDKTDLVIAADALEQAGHLELAERLRAGAR